MLNDFGKALILIGAVVMLAGAFILLAGRLGFRGLPGDIHVEGENYRVFFPVVTCIVISAVLTLGVWLFRWLSR